MKISSYQSLYPGLPVSRSAKQPQLNADTSHRPQAEEPTLVSPPAPVARQAMSAYELADQQRVESIRESFAYAEAPRHLAVRKALSEYQDTALNEQRSELQSLGVDVFA